MNQNIIIIYECQPTGWQDGLSVNYFVDNFCTDISILAKLSEHKQIVLGLLLKLVLTVMLNLIRSQGYILHVASLPPCIPCLPTSFSLFFNLNSHTKTKCYS
jgi:hypothetical protein